MSLPSKSKKREILLPKLKKIDYSKKKIRYKLKDGVKRRRAAINDGVRMEQKKTGKTRKKAAIAKKGRFNILDFGVDENLKKALDITTQMAFAAGLLALRDLLRKRTRRGPRRLEDGLQVHTGEREAVPIDLAKYPNPKA